MRLFINPSNIGDSYQAIGVNVAFGWSDNKPDIAINYGPSQSQTVYIEDVYDLDGKGDQQAIDIKVNAITAHLDKSTSNGQQQSAWYIAFASATNDLRTTPEGLALGPTSINDIIGINDRLVKYMVEKKGQYFGVILFDFYGSDQKLANATLGYEVSG
jgi:1-phosphatidylinositol phosphodiesterase